MRKLLLVFVFLPFLVLLASCSSTQYGSGQYYSYKRQPMFLADYSYRVPPTYATNGEKVILVDPHSHAWGAYAANGKLVRAGIATAGGTMCPPDADPGEKHCRTGVGSFRITSMGGGECASKKYPRPRGGGLMPYCMYFNGGQALHGSPDDIVVDGNISHGCVRMRIPDAEWMRNKFASVGTKVVVTSY